MREDKVSLKPLEETQDIATVLLKEISFSSNVSCLCKMMEMQFESTNQKTEK